MPRARSIVVLLSILLVCLAIPAYGTELSRIEAETQDTSFTTQMLSQSPPALRWDGNGTVAYSVDVPANSTAERVIVRSKAGGNNTDGVTLSVVAGGSTTPTQSIGRSATTYQLRTFDIPDLPSGAQSIGIKAGALNGNDKLFVDYFIVDGTSTPTDTDGDGVLDADDNCPNEPGPASNQGCPVTPASSSCPTSGTVVDVNPGDDLDAKANAAPAGATIKVHGPQGTFYTVDQAIDLKADQTLIGDAGTITQVDPANVPNTVVGMRAANTGMSTMLKAVGDNWCVEWLDIDVQGAQKAINGLAGGPNQKMIHVKVHEAQASGIGQYRGFVLDSEVYGNGTNPVQFDGTVAGIKMNYAGEVARSYVHDNPGNGIWCDVGCQSVPNQPNGWYVHDNVAGDNGRHGIFYENAPKPSINWGDTTVKGLMENNVVYGNGKSGISVSDTQAGTVTNNILGKTVDGVIDHNLGLDGIELHSSGALDRGIQKDAVITNNQMNGEVIDGTGTDRDGTPNEGCGDNGNVCSGNV